MARRPRGVLNPDMPDRCEVGFVYPPTTMWSLAKPVLQGRVTTRTTGHIHGAYFAEYATVLTTPYHQIISSSP